MSTLLVGHSWVRRLRDLSICPEEYEFVCKGGATFASISDDVERYFNRLGSRPKPKIIFVFLGSNDLDNLSGTAEVFQVTESCSALCSLLRQVSPGSKLVFAQVEDRFTQNHLEDNDAMLSGFKAKSNKFNKWLNKWQGKDGVFIMKGRRGFSDASLYARDGIHLNFDGNVKLAERLRDFNLAY